MSASKLLIATGLLCGALMAVARAQLAVAQPQPPSDKASHASAANGKAVFMRIGCYTCHGTVGQGGAGAKLAPNTLPLAAFQTWVRTGTPGWNIARGMPAFPALVLSDAELADVREYLATLPPPPSVKNVRLLNP